MQTDGDIKKEEGEEDSDVIELLGFSILEFLMAAAAGASGSSSFPIEPNWLKSNGHLFSMKEYIVNMKRKERGKKFCY